MKAEAKVEERDLSLNLNLDLNRHPGLELGASQFSLVSLTPKMLSFNVGFGAG